MSADDLDLPVAPLPSRVRRHRRQRRRSAALGSLVWLGEVVLAGIGWALFVLAALIVSGVLFIILLTVVLWIVARQFQP